MLSALVPMAVLVGLAFVAGMLVGERQEMQLTRFWESQSDYWRHRCWRAESRAEERDPADWWKEGGAPC